METEGRPVRLKRLWRPMEMHTSKGRERDSKRLIEYYGNWREY